MGVPKPLTLVAFVTLAALFAVGSVTPVVAKRSDAAASSELELDVEVHLLRNQGATVRKARVLTQAAAEQGGAQTAPGGEEGETQAGDAGAGGTAGEEQQELVQQAIENGVAVDVITTDDAAASGATEIDQAQQDQAQQEEHAQQEGASSEENAADSEFGKVLVGEAEIDAQTKEATELQEKRDELEDPLPVQLIATEAAAVVANGDGDVATTGASLESIQIAIASLANDQRGH